MLLNSTNMEKWYFTFGSGQVHANCFIVFKGSFYEAREKMFNSFGNKWSMQYSEEEWNEGGISQQEKYNLKEIK